MIMDQQAAQGEPITIFGDGRQVRDLLYIGDLLDALVRAEECLPAISGEAFNIGDTKPLTQVEVVEKMAKVANADVVLARVPRDVIVSMGGSVLEEPYYFGEYFDLPPITMNIGKVTRMLKMKLTPFEIGLKETYRWYLRNHKPRTSGFEFDDKLLVLAKTGSPASV